MNRLASLAVLSVAAFSGMAAAQTRVDEIVARVNNQIILKSEMDKELKRLADDLKQQNLTPAQTIEKTKEESRDLLRNMIDVTLFMQIAKEQNIDVEPTITKRLYEIMVKNKLPDMDALIKALQDQGLSIEDIKENWRRDLLTQEVMSREVASRIVISTEDMRKFYDENKETFKHKAGTMLGQIGVSKMPSLEEQRKKIEEAYAKLKAGADFGETAAKYSEMDNADRGGVVGFIDADDYGDLLPAIAETLPKLEKGQISEILDMGEGFLILKALDKHPGGILSFELAQNEVFSAMIPTRLQPKVREYLNKLREEGFVEVKEGYTDTGAVKKVERTPKKGEKKEAVNKKPADKSKDAEKEKEAKEAKDAQKGKKT